MSTTYEETRLSPTLTLRPVKWTDLEQVAQLIYDVCEADGDATVAVTPDDLRLEWLTPGFNLETDAYLVETNDGQIVGFEEFNNRHKHATLETDGYVHPKFTGLGIGTTMLRAIEVRARKEMILAEQDVRVTLHSTIDNRDQASHDLHKNEGYQPVRYHWRMEIKLEASPAVPTLPQGIELRPFNKDKHARAVLDAQNDAFRDQWGSHAMEFEGWSLRKFGHKDFDPSLWLIAWDGDQIAGFSQNRFRMGIGWVGTLGVRAAWRKRGLGEALLLHSFGNFYQRGIKTIGLGVDASNPTGATRLYQKVGMHIASQFLTYEKELRAGRELEEQE
jgi:mycothiol synthase